MSAAVGSVAVAVASWNGRRHLETLLPALEAQDDPGVPWEVLLFDNGSRDGTAAWVRRAFPRVRLVESPVNQGFCAANNRLVEASGADAVALLNNDTRPRRDWLAALVGALAAAPAEVAAVSGMIVDWEGERLDFARGAMTFDGHAFQVGFRRPLAGPGAAEVPADGAELPFPCGGNLLVRRGSFLAAGGFDEDRYPHPSIEDIDLGHRLTARGALVLLDPAIQGTHLKAWTLRSMLWTDFARRGVPWVALQLRDRRLSTALNCGWRHRLSAASCAFRSLMSFMYATQYAISPSLSWIGTSSNSRKYSMPFFLYALASPSNGER